MLSDKKLVSFHIVESLKNERGKSLFRWTYPNIQDTTAELILSKCFISLKDEVCFCVCKKNLWIYMDQWKCNHQNTYKAIVLITEEFEPNKYKTLCKVLSKMYKKTSNPVDLVKLYLNLFTNGTCAFQDNGALISYDLDNFKSKKKIKDFIKMFGVEVIIIYVTILLKKRLIVYHKNIELLQEDLFTISYLVSQRNPNEYLYPFVDSTKALNGLPFYVAGTVSNKFCEYPEIYDAYLDLETQEFTISPQAKQVFSMTKIHKDIATYLVHLSNSEKEDEHVISEISAKTQGLIDQLKSIANVVTEDKVKLISVDDLKERKLSPAIENFLVQLATAENMLML